MNRLSTLGLTQPPSRLPLELPKQLLVLHIRRHGHHHRVAILHEPGVHKPPVLQVDKGQGEAISDQQLNIELQPDGHSIHHIYIDMWPQRWLARIIHIEMNNPPSGLRLRPGLLDVAQG